MCSPLSQHRHPLPRGGQWWSRRDPCSLSARDRFWAVVCQLKTAVWSVSSVPSLLHLSLLCPSQPITPCSLCQLCSVVEPWGRAGGAHVSYMGSRHVSVHRLWQSSCCHRLGPPLMCCLCKHQQWQPPPCHGPIRRHPGSEFSLYPLSELSPRSWQSLLQCRAVRWSKCGWSIHLVQAGARTGVVTGNWAATGAVLSQPSAPPWE